MYETDPVADLTRVLESKLLESSRGLPRPVVAPALSYGRHRGPTRPNARIAAVAIALFQDEDDQWMIPLTLRPDSLQHHAGQVCLPGGRLEGDENPSQAALREFEEELGVRAEVTCHCGELSALYVYASNNLVHPVVSIISRPTKPWQPDPVEVAEVIMMPLVKLLRNREECELALRREVRQGGKPVDHLVFRATAIQVGQHKVWGATAMILDQLAQILLPTSTN
ncbi:MAG: NUDIX hydrolase [Rubripirellula sp.]